MPDPLNSNVVLDEQLPQLLGVVIGSPLVEIHRQENAWLFTLMVKLVPILPLQMTLPPPELQWALVTVPLASRTSTAPGFKHTATGALVSVILLPLRIEVDFALLMACVRTPLVLTDSALLVQVFPNGTVAKAKVAISANTMSNSTKVKPECRSTSSSHCLCCNRQWCRCQLR